MCASLVNISCITGTYMYVKMGMLYFRVDLVEPAYIVKPADDLDSNFGEIQIK